MKSDDTVCINIYSVLNIHVHIITYTCPHMFFFFGGGAEIERKEGEGWMDLVAVYCIKLAYIEYLSKNSFDVFL